MRLWRSIAKRTRTTFLYNHKIHGRLLLDSSEPMSLTLYSGYEYETDEFALIQTHLRTHPTDVFFDIGANWGGYSLLAARCGVPQIEAFEPNRKVFGLLAANITLNRFHNRIRAWNIAAGDTDCETELHIDPRATEVSTLAPGAMPEKWQYSDVQRCLVRRIGDLLPIRDKTVFIKVDVEGFERQAIAGLSSLLETNKVHMMVEVLNDQDAFRDFAEAHGLTFVSHFGSNFFFETAGAATR